MIKDMKTRISKLNIDFESYWEPIYLILLAFFIGMRFLLSTMFTIYWPKYFYRTLTVIGVVLVLLHLMRAKDISKKEIAAMLVVTFVFMMSHYVSGYDFLVDLLILILGAYRVNFRNILKTYIAVWSVLLVVTIIGAMAGPAENLVFVQGEGSEGERVRMALGICYPTDLAAYVVFIMLAYVYLREQYITYLEIVIMFLLTIAVYYITDARTDFAIMLLLIIGTIIIKKIERIIVNNTLIKKFFICYPIIMCLLVWILTLMYDGENELLVRLNESVISNRLSLGRQAIDNYGFSFFGKYVLEKGYGGATEPVWPYFFIDSSYISIGIKYGILMEILVVLYNLKLIKKCLDNNKTIIYIIIVCLGLQAVMEHHIIQYWYNPFILIPFVLIGNNRIDKQDDVINLN